MDFITEGHFRGQLNYHPHLYKSKPRTRKVSICTWSDLPMVTQPTWQSGLKLCCFHTCDAHIVLNPSLLSSFSPAAFLLSTVKVEIAMLWSVISSSLLPAYFVFHPLLPPLQATFLSAPSHPDFQKEKYIVSLLISFIVHSFLNPQPTMPDISLKLLFSKSQTSVFSFR